MSAPTLIRWSPQQLAIFEWFAKGTGNLVIVARAGTGKTTSLLEAISHAPEQRILMTAFNKKIAEELQTRLRNPRAEAKTLHALGFAALRRYWLGVRVDDERGLRLATTAVTAVLRSEHEKALAEWYAAGGRPDDRPQPEIPPDVMIRLVKKLAALGKNAAPFPQQHELEALALAHDLTADDEWEQEGWTVKRLATCAMRAMDLAAEKDGSIDFDDMVFVPIRNRWMRGTYDLVVVDECQDMSATQIHLAVAACRKGGRIAVIGDNRQAIYGFRGADSESLNRLKNELHATELKLTVTRRCPKTVVALAAALVPDFEAAPDAPEGTVSSCGAHALGKQVRPGDFVLSRKNAPLTATCLSLLREGHRARIEGKDIGRTLIAIVRKLHAKDMEQFAAKLGEWETKEIAKLRALATEAAEKKIETVQDQAETLRVLSEGLLTVPEIEARVESMFADNVDPSGFVVCSSIHRSKGLERERVFVLKDTLYPGGKRDNIEEQNIEYVAVTRAKRELVWVSSVAAAMPAEPKPAPIAEAPKAPMEVASPVAAEGETENKPKVLHAAVDGSRRTLCGRESKHIASGEAVSCVHCRNRLTDRKARELAEALPETFPVVSVRRVGECR